MTLIPADLYSRDAPLPPPFDGGQPLRLTSFEEVRVLATRVVQIQNAAPSPTLKFVDDATTAVEIAHEEMRRGIAPLVIRRPKSVGGDGRVLHIEAGRRLRPAAS